MAVTKLARAFRREQGTGLASLTGAPLAPAKASAYRTGLRERHTDPLMSRSNRARALGGTSSSASVGPLPGISHLIINWYHGLNGFVKRK